MHAPTRRGFLKSSFAAGLALPTIANSAAAKIVAPAPRQFGFSLYGMKGVSLDDAVQICTEIGYGGIELALLPGFPTEPTSFSKDDRKQFRDGTKLEVCGLMENLVAVTSEAEHRRNLDRIARAAELAHDVHACKVLETTLGGKPADWPNVRDPMIERLGDWAETARRHDLSVAIKPHVSGAVHRPEAAAELLEAVNSPRLGAAFDYSHYQVQGLPLEASVAALSGRILFAHVKDGRRVDGKVQFLLPGEGDTDYVRLFQCLASADYRGWLTVEVSNQISSRSDYDPRVAAQRSYDHLISCLKKLESAPAQKP